MSEKKGQSNKGSKRRENECTRRQKNSLSLRCYGLRILISLFLMAAVLVAYEPVRNNEFIDFDDDVYVTDNPDVKAGLTLKSVFWAFSTFRATNWHPLTWLSHMVDFELYGLNPRGHHTTNLLLHIMNTLFLFLILHRMTGELWGSGFVAALFALHPLGVESVAWVAERKNGLSTLFWMLTMWAYISYVQRPILTNYLLVTLSFILGLLSKPMLVTLPFVMLLLDYWPLCRFEPGHSNNHSQLDTYQKVKPVGPKSSMIHLILEKIPFFALSAGSCVATILAAHGGGAIGSPEMYPLEIRIANALISYVSYIWKMIWPHPLAVLYPYPSVFPMWQIVGAGLLLTCITMFTIRSARKRPYLLVGWFWYLGTLFPVIGMVQVGTQGTADRYTYVPLIGLFIMIANGVPDILGGWTYKRILLAIGVILVLPVLMVLTRMQVSHWKNSNTLFAHTLNVTSNNSRIHNNLGFALVLQGKTKEAIPHYTEALRIDPYFAAAHYNLGVALSEQGNIQEAIAHYLEALRINPSHAGAHNKLGMILARQGKNQEAVVHFTQAIRIRPGYADLYSNLGNSQAELGKLEEAVASYAAALRIKPDHFGVHYNLAIALVRQGKIQEAISHFIESLRIKPDFAEAHFNLGLTYLMVGNRSSAMEEYRILKTINPDLANILSRSIYK
jgi:tetratricopeptide (TPR) repeat protein